MSNSGRQGHQKTGDQKVQYRDREQELPGKAHQLVITEAGQGRANPDENEKQSATLSQKPEERHQDRDQRRDQHQRSQPEEDNTEYRQRVSVERARRIQSVIN